MIGSGVTMALAGLVVMGVAVLGWRGRLPRNFFAGVRTPGTLRSDEKFRAANRVAAPPQVAGGAVMVIGGVLAAVLPTRDGEPVLAAVLVAGVLIVIGAVRGVRAARAARSSGGRF